MNKFVNYKETESQNKLNESVTGNDIINFNQFPNSFYKREKHSDDSVLNVKAQAFS